MTAMAVYLQQAGYFVTGSDVIDVFPTDKILADNKILVKRGFSPKNLDDDYDLVVVTGAHGGMTNIEAIYAKKRGIPTFMHGVFLGELLNTKVGISVAGCHGKTTTASLIAFLLDKSGFKPSYAIGTAQINGLGAAGHFGKGAHFIAEADEYMTCPSTDRTPRFLYQKPKFLVITNIEFDHPDAYPDLQSVKDAFIKLASNMPKDGLIVACIDNSVIKEVLPYLKTPYLTYGFSPLSDFRISKSYFGKEISFVRFTQKNIDLGEFILKVPGRHNQLNSLAACIVANQVGLGWDKIRELLKQYTGNKRRFEKKAFINGIYLFDDYAHHPSEIMATIKAAKGWYENHRVVIVFQPHTYSRTKKLLDDFAQSFVDADLVILADIYPSAREDNDPTINSKILTDRVNMYKKNAVYQKDKKAVMMYLSQVVKSGDVVILMGAGDIYLWSDDCINILEGEQNE